MTNLHTRLLAAVQQRMDVARAATDEDGPFDGTGIVVMRLHGGGIRTVTLTSGVARFLAANDPATVLRHCERDLRVLERHVPSPAFTERQICMVCRRPGYMSVEPWPCPEILDLAAAYGVDVDGG